MAADGCCSGWCQDCITGSSCLCKSGVRIPNVTETSLHCRMLGVTAPWDWRWRKCCCSYASRCCTWTNVSPATRTHPQPPRATQPGVHTGKLRHNKYNVISCSKKWISSKLLLFISDILLIRQKYIFIHPRFQDTALAQCSQNLSLGSYFSISLSLPLTWIFRR